MNLPDSYYLDDEKPKTAYQSTNKGYQTQDLGGLGIGYNPESGLKAVFLPSDNEQQKMEDTACQKYGYSHKKGGNDYYN